VGITSTLEVPCLFWKDAEEDMAMKNVWYVCLVVLLSFCASTAVTSVKSPQISGKSYERIVIYFPYDDLAVRNIVEKQFVDKFDNIGIQGFSALHILPPTENYSDTEVNRILRQHAIDAILIVVLKDYSTTTSYTTNISGSLAQTYPVSKPRAHTELRLYDTATGQNVWLATSMTRGNAFAKVPILAASLATQATQKLLADNMIGGTSRVRAGDAAQPAVERMTK
jgi:hypothetical protein